MIETDDLSTFRLLTYIKGPDFPTAGSCSHQARAAGRLRVGSGSLKLRGEWRAELDGKVPQIIVTSIPYGGGSTIVEKIAE